MALAVPLTRRDCFGPVWLDFGVSRMSNVRTGIAVGGERRLRKAIEAQVRAKHQAELAACGDSAQKASVEKKIRREIAEELKRVVSPFSLWSVR